MKQLQYVLDTDMCIYTIKQHPAAVIKKFKSFTPGDIGISSITMAELYYGAHKSQHQDRNLRALENFVLPLEILPFDDMAAAAYGNIRASLEKNGTPIGPLDQMIAAHVLSLKLTLVTNNLKEFSRIKELRIENWVH